MERSRRSEGLRRPIIDSIDQRIPPGAPAKFYVYGVLTVGAVASLMTKSWTPFKTVLQGLEGATTSNTINAVVNHKFTPHGSAVPKNEATITAARFLQAALVGGHTDWSSAMHEVHHPNADTILDPHAPINSSRREVFLTLNRNPRLYSRGT